jgi:hypothetical protein
VAGGGEQAVDLLDAEHPRQFAPALGSFDDRGRVIATPPFGIEETIELADRRKPARDRACCEFALGEVAQIAAHIVRCRIRDAAFPGHQIVAEILQIAPIGRERVRTCATLGREHVEEQLDVRCAGRSGLARHRGPASVAWRTFQAGLTR